MVFARLDIICQEDILPVAPTQSNQQYHLNRVARDLIRERFGQLAIIIQPSFMIRYSLTMTGHIWPFGPFGIQVHSTLVFAVLHGVPCLQTWRRGLLDFTRSQFVPVIMRQHFFSLLMARGLPA